MLRKVLTKIEVKGRACVLVCTHMGLSVCQYIIMLKMDERDESHSVAKATDRAVNTLPLTHLSTIEPLSPFFYTVYSNPFTADTLSFNH